MKAIATIRFNITGTERKFKIEGVTAQGVYVLFPFSKQEEGIPTESLQRLVLLREGASDFEESYPLAFGRLSPAVLGSSFGLVILVTVLFLIDLPIPIGSCESRDMLMGHSHEMSTWTVETTL